MKLKLFALISKYDNKIVETKYFRNKQDAINSLNIWLRDCSSEHDKIIGYYEQDLIDLYQQYIGTNAEEDDVHVTSYDQFIKTYYPKGEGWYSTSTMEFIGEFNSDSYTFENVSFYIKEVEVDYDEQSNLYHISGDNYYNVMNYIEYLVKVGHYNI